ncbi:hypothetical protein DFH08DRAFT_891813 [Mycena albidolilacea]|uniref:Secreted protein n=1 Tax=Mycena albidolilacea TaxID=1033008 RepID=A0AAD7EG45_9AGAR|nr:hypothetical protein DFH08DRAFT_891813 [Mycena albidolilacea]
MKSRMILLWYFRAFPGISIANLPENMFARRRGRSRWTIRSPQRNLCSSRFASLTHEFWAPESPSEQRSVLIHIATARSVHSGCKQEAIIQTAGAGSDT